MEYVLTDTAGMRKKSSITNIIEKKSVNQSLSSIRDSDICVLLVDATQKIQKQDLLIANRVLDSGRGLIVVLSKWDLITEKIETKLGKKFNVVGAVTQLGILGCDIRNWNDKFISKNHLFCQKIPIL